MRSKAFGNPLITGITGPMGSIEGDRSCEDFPRRFRFFLSLLVPVEERLTDPLSVVPVKASEPDECMD